MTRSPVDVALAAVQKLADRVDALPSIREATVAATSPLAVRFDTDTASTVVYATTTAGLAVNDRVLTIRLRRYIWVIGKRII